MEPPDDSGRWMFIAHLVCCGGPLLLVLIAGNAALLLSVVRSGAFWAGTALLLGSVTFFLIRRRRACRIRPPMVRPGSPQAADPSTGLRAGSAQDGRSTAASRVGGQVP